MAVYRFKVVFDEQDDVSREIDIKGFHTFKDLHDFILQSVGFDTKHSASLFISDDMWRAGDEFVLREEDKALGAHGKKKTVPARLMEKGKLVSFIEDPHQKFIYIYDYEVQWTFMIELMKIITEDQAAIYPRVFKSTGMSPKQYKQVLPVAGAEEDDKGLLGALLLKDEEEEPTREQIVVADEGLDDEDMHRASQMSEEGEESDGGEDGDGDGEDEEGESGTEEAQEQH